MKKPSKSKVTNISTNICTVFSSQAKHKVWCLKFIFSKKATKIDKIFTVSVKLTVKISSNFVALLEKINFKTPDKIWSNQTYVKCSDAATSNLQIFKSVRVRTRSRLWHVIKFIKGENAENERSWVMICYKNFRQKRWQGDCRYKKKLYKLTNSCVEMEVCMYVIHFWKLRSLFWSEILFVDDTIQSLSQNISKIWEKKVSL